MSQTKIVIRYLFCLVVCGFAMCGLTACSIPKPPAKEQIAKDLPSDLTTAIIENPFDATDADVYEMDVTEIVIEKRQTNEKDDTVYCWVELENEYYHFIKYVTLNYNFYDQGGWILDGYSEYAPAEWEVVGVPFDADDVSSVLDYGIASSGTITSDLQGGVVKYSFLIEDAHNNGTYKGVAVVECQFDGQKWTFEKETDDVQFIWDIVGTWKYCEIEETSYSSTINEIVVTIEDFDQGSMSINGTWYMNSQYSFLRSHSEDMVSLDNKERVQINMGNKDSLIQLWGDPNKMGMHSYVEFYPDTVVACYATHFGQVQLERQNASMEYPTLGTISTEISKELSSVINQYFKIVKNGVGDEDGARMLLKQAYPNLLGDDVIDELQYYLEENWIDDFSYEIVTANQYSMDQNNARQMWAIAIEEEFYDGIPNPDAFAEILVKITFEIGDTSFYLEEEGYCDFLLVQDCGAWGIFFADDIRSEPPQMLFPF